MDNLKSTRVKEKELEKLRQREELYWHQRSQVAWLKSGDRNTSFFHSKATNRRRKNRIDKIKDDRGMCGGEVMTKLFI